MLANQENQVNETAKISPNGLSHSFDTGIAMACGVEAAIIYNHLFLWLHHNKLNNMNQHDGRTWTYDSIDRINEYLPYLTYKQIKYGLSKLAENKLILVGNYSKDKFDRTNWYALFDESSLCFSKKSFEGTSFGSSRSQNGRIEGVDFGSSRDAVLANPHITCTGNLTSFNTSSKVPQAEPPPDGGLGDLASPSSSKKEKQFSPEVIELTDRAIEILKSENSVWKPPTSKKALYEAVALLINSDGHSPQKILETLLWACNDQYKGPALFKGNFFATLRKNFAVYHKAMTSKPKEKPRTFAPCSDQARAKSAMDRMMETSL